ncbi:MAG: hypothetical protein V3S22_02260 [Candidatus Neomarinimicrobiota bacterium]
MNILTVVLTGQQQAPIPQRITPKPVPIIKPSEKGSLTLRDLDFTVLKLSYIQTDRALGILKALGYSVIEFDGKKGETPFEKIFTPKYTNNNLRNLDLPGVLPVIIKLPDTENISMVEKAKVVKSSKQTILGVDLGGVILENTTSGEPLQRLLIGYKPGDFSGVARLLDLFHNKIDVPAAQIVIEALVLELNSDQLDELGIDFSTSGSGYLANFKAADQSTGSLSPFTLVLDQTLLGRTSNFRANIAALVSSKTAEVLSKPSILVLDGRQARIQIGQQIPIVKTTDTDYAQTRSVDYIPVGIVLNLRPRISEDGTMVTIQVETIISETEQRIGAIGAVGSAGVEEAPVINNRKVQTIVRVANNTPFIIGGLINTKKTLSNGGIPILKDLPLIGRLFSISSEQEIKKEVIVVITPHIIIEGEDNFSRVIPQDSELFNSFGNRSFPNSYRVQHTDVFDLRFIYESPIFKSILDTVKIRAKNDKELIISEPYKGLIEGRIPGEGILVRRMLYDIIEKLDYFNYIDPYKVLFFHESSEDPAGFSIAPLAQEILKRNGKVLQLSFSLQGKATKKNPFVRPTAALTFFQMTGSYKNVLKEKNRRGHEKNEDIFTILISRDKDERRLYEVLVMKKVLEMNPDLKLTLNYFKPGIEILFPSPAVLMKNNHIVDLDAARYFYEVNDYYGSFEEEFNRQTAELSKLIQE